MTYGNTPAMPADFTFWLEVAIALAVTAVMVIGAMLTLKERHRDTASWHVWIGAGIQGAIYGALVGFIFVPLRIALVQGEVPSQFVLPSSLGALVIIIMLRRGVFSHLPFLGPQVRAYRRALLRRTIEAAEKQLDRLTPKDGSLTDGAAQ